MWHMCAAAAVGWEHCNVWDEVAATAEERGFRTYPGTEEPVKYHIPSLLESITITNKIKDYILNLFAIIAQAAKDFQPKQVQKF